MTEIVSPSPAASPSPPAAPPPSRSVWPWIWLGIGAAVVLGAVAVVVVNWTSTAPGTAQTASRGPAVCDMATAYPAPDGRHGVVVHVQTSGPDVVTVEINTGGTDHRRLVQQLTKHHDGATFAFAETFWGVDSITVSTDKLGSCEVPVPEKVR
jgi:hypothetical protein